MANAFGSRVELVNVLDESPNAEMLDLGSSNQ